MTAEKTSSNPRRDRLGRIIGYNWWREYIVDAWFWANHSWELQMEAVSMGYETEEKQYKESSPRPLLKDFMIHLAGSEPPERDDGE